MLQIFYIITYYNQHTPTRVFKENSATKAKPCVQKQPVAKTQQPPKHKSNVFKFLKSRPNTKVTRCKSTTTSQTQRQVIVKTQQPFQHKSNVFKFLKTFPNAKVSHSRFRKAVPTQRQRFQVFENLPQREFFSKTQAAKAKLAYKSNISERRSGNF